MTMSKRALSKKTKKPKVPHSEMLKTLQSLETPKGRVRPFEPVPFQSRPVPPLTACRYVGDYFVASLGVPDPPGRLGELREDYPINSVVGLECKAAIDA